MGSARGRWRGTIAGSYGSCWGRRQLTPLPPPAAGYVAAFAALAPLVDPLCNLLYDALRPGIIGLQVGRAVGALWGRRVQGGGGASRTAGLPAGSAARAAVEARASPAPLRLHVATPRLLPPLPPTARTSTPSASWWLC